PKEEGKRGMVKGVKEFISNQVGRLTPSKFKAPTTPEKVLERGGIPSAARFLPEQLKLTSVGNMMELLGANPDSRQSRNQVLEKMAHPEKITDPTEQKNIKTVQREIETRAKEGDEESVRVQSEIKGRQSVKTEIKITETPGMPMEIPTMPVPEIQKAPKEGPKNNDNIKP
ncbi:MAG: hypothetical protein V1760_01370, partial [Candidatus Peregrinibacteria bacterium]